MRAVKDTTVGTPNTPHAGEEAFPTHGTHSRHPLAHRDAFPSANESHEPAADPHAPGKNKSSATPVPPDSHEAQQRRMSDQQAAAIGKTIIRALSGEDILENFLKKYPRPTPGSGAGVGPIKSTTHGAGCKSRSQAPDYQSKRAEKLREKRRRLRELQEWEFQKSTTPPRRANPSVIGLLSCGMTYILLGLHYTGYFALDTVVPAMAICLGGGVQMIAGMLSWVQGSTFAYVSFATCSGFFTGLVCVWMLPNQSFMSDQIVQQSTEYFTGVFFCIWGVFFTFSFISAMRMNLCILLKELTMALSQLCLAGGMMAGNDTAIHAGGYFGIISGAAALYLCFACLLNEVWDSVLLPVFPITDVLEGAPLFSKKTEEAVAEAESKEETTSAADLRVSPAA
ncbi:hypothetical protein ABL78_7763 [Leptomonas seymouri]|uniref:GPR1/FUN34/yaaH family n=1 Tax=Leptomonas seymouri TaxID=5684 RepID=A0A0N1I1I5_LEPSE|nr:hypothetical protein ABL78_7763 [Leptomonas seymouri]|eukprot:KPI83214.1 hypothetical protein ABL78_7763 [Leptomonas seymouri]